jgi:aconitase A
LLTNQAWPIDFLLGVTKMLRKPKVVGGFVEFFGEGIPALCAIFFELQ